ncbi:MAG: response regulator [Deltaproteobacteria bacterium]|nr:response regulator [Deltaproteobacteria bacterium]
MAETKILVVEDEGIVAEDIRRSLQNLGYTVSAVVSSGQEAVKKAEEYKPDLVLMDIVLKGEIDGIEAANQIRLCFNIPVVYLTAYADERTMDRAKVTEPFGYIVKPFEDRELRMTIEMALYKHKTENKLREREEWLSTTLGSIGDAVIATDAHGHIRFMNPVAESLTGWKEGDADGKSLTEVFNIINEETRKLVESPVTKVLRKGVVVGLANHTLLVARDGAEIPIDDSGAPIRDAKGDIIGVVLVFRDIRERRKAERDLQESERRYRGLYETALVGLYRSRISDGKIIMANQLAANILGYSSIEGLTTEFVFGERYSPDRRTELLRKLEECGTVSDFEIQVTRKDGEKIDLIKTARAYPEYGYIEGAIIDVTEKKRLEAQLLQAQKMEAIGALAGGIAHNFNNLLMVIGGYASLMLSDLDSSHPHYSKLKQIEEQVRSGSELTAQLLGFARRGKYNVKPLDVNEIMRSSAGMFGRTKKQITIREKYDPDLCAVEADQGQIEQALLNLYVNAWQAMPAGGDIYLETNNVILDESYIKPYKVQPGRYARISVTDTGVGMDETIRRRVFEPFFTTKEMGRGSGLGLASAYGIIKNHGGIINVYSEKGHGTTFTIYLPASEKEVVGEKEMSVKMVKGTETILFVDDEEMIRNVGRELLKEFGYKVLIARDGEEAVNIYKANKDGIDLVILDMIMPGIGGGETYDRLKKIDPGIRVLLSSGYSINGEASKILERGCSGFIQKPFNMQGLSTKIREVLDKTY